MHNNHKPRRPSLLFGWSLFFLCVLVTPLWAQGPPGGSNDPGDPLVNLVLVAEKLLPKLQEVIESPLVAGLESLAFWLSVLVMLLSFARLLRENDGGGKDLFWWCCRLGIIFTLFGAGRTIINTASQIG